MSQKTNQPMSPMWKAPSRPSATATVPIWLIVALGALVFWGSVYLDGHAGGFSRVVFAPYTNETDIASLQPYDPERAFLAKGEFVFNQTCKACHQDNGLGKPGQYPPLAGSDWLLAPSPARIGRIVLRGLSGSNPGGGSERNLHRKRSHVSMGGRLWRRGTGGCAELRAQSMGQQGAQNQARGNQGHSRRRGLALRSIHARRS